MSTPISGAGGGSSNAGTTDVSFQTTQAAIQQLLQQAETPAVSFGGLVSGIDTPKIVQALLAAQRAPILQLQSQQANEQAKLKAWQDVSAQLQGIQAAATTISLEATVNAKTVSVPNDVASGTVNPTASLGSFQLQVDQLATATHIRSSNGIVGSDVITSSAKLSAPVTAGTFTVNGLSVAVSSGETFDQLFAAVSAQTGGVVAGAIVDNRVQFSSTDGSNVALGAGGDTSNFLTVANLAAAPAAPVVLSASAVGVGSSGIGSAITGNDIGSVSSKLAAKITAGVFTVNGQPVTVHLGDSINVILASIATATGGAVTGSVANNHITLQSAAAIHLGSGGDSSNFLSVAKVLGQPAATSISSSGPVGVVSPGATLDKANIAGLDTNVSTGSFSINGVSVSYDPTKDTLNDVLGRINASAAGVTAAYDPNADSVELISSKTGNIDVSVSDGTGNLMARLGLASPDAHQLGESAKYEINGGPAQFSLSNTISNIVPGVKLTLQSTTASAVAVTVQQDASVGSKAVQDFVAAYNDLVDLIARDTAYDSDSRVAGILLGDSSLRTLQQDLDTALFVAGGARKGFSPPYVDVTTVGLDTGNVGSAPGTTSHLQFKDDTFKTALESNPAAVTHLLTGVFHDLSKRVLDMLAPFGPLDTMVRGQNRQIDDLQRRIDSQIDFLSRQEQVLTKQFNDLDGTLAQLQSQSSTGAAVLSALSAKAASGGSGSGKSS